MKTHLNKLTEAGEEGSFAIFDADPGRFVQFVGGKEIGLICDIPLAELSNVEKNRLVSLLKFSGEEHLNDAGECSAYQIAYENKEVDKAAELADRIFIEVFMLPSDYNVKAEISL